MPIFRIDYIAIADRHPMLFLFAVWAPHLVTILAIAVLVGGRLLVRNGPAIVNAISALRPVFVTLLQLLVVGSCLFQLAIQTTVSSEALEHVDNARYMSEALPALPGHLAAFTGLLVAAVTAICVIEATAADQWPTSVAGFLELRPLNFGECFLP